MACVAADMHLQFGFQVCRHVFDAPCRSFISTSHITVLVVDNISTTNKCSENGCKNTAHKLLTSHIEYSDTKVVVSQLLNKTMAAMR